MRSDYSADDFRHPERFRTSHDVNPIRARLRYLAGIEECKDYSEIFICLNDTICATLRVGNGQFNGYEKLGYHAYTSEYLHAILDSGCPVWVSRIDSDDRIHRTQIK